ncbi:MAG: hypothetical protein FVQ85_21895 [Planctomycetes bacterium]|nr:hypothetical protein [Planctomycetota bacterium]
MLNYYQLLAKGNWKLATILSPIISCAYRLSSLNCQPIMTFIMQNEPNFPDDQMNVTKAIIADYENKCDWTLGENEPKRTQFIAS